MPARTPRPKALACELPTDLITFEFGRLVERLLDSCPDNFQDVVWQIRHDPVHLRSFADAVKELVIHPLATDRDSLLFPTAEGNVFKAFAESDQDEVPDFLRASSQVHARECEAVA